jgi:holliday junction DNA helicase RuvA
MFEYIRGKLSSATPNKAIVEAGGIGYEVLIGLNSYGKLPQTGQEVHLFLLLVVREDAHTLYGFLTQAEKQFFNTLIGISGIGPKTALSLLGRLELAELHRAILQEEISLLMKVPGIGKKSAERLVIELKDKIKTTHADLMVPGGPSKLSTDAVGALVHLGYHPLQAQQAVQKALHGTAAEPELGKLIKTALQKL